MIKAKKGLLIALFAAMMVFAFGATSAFAANAPEASWNADYTSVDVTYDGVTKTYTNITKVWGSEAIAPSSVTPAAGMVSAYVDFSTWTADTRPAWDTDATGAVNTNYCDLTGAYLTKGALGANTTRLTQTQYDYLAGSGATLNTVCPSYAKNYAAGMDAQNPSFTNPTVAIVTSEVKESTADQTGTVSAEWTWTTGTAAKLVGQVADRTVTVAGTAAVDCLYLDGVKVQSGNLTSDQSYRYNARYDGEAHTIAMGEVEGWTIAYSKFNSKTGAWDAINGTEITIKNVADNGTYRATYTKGTKTITWTITDEMRTARRAFSFGFDSSVTGYTYVEIANEAEPVEFVTTVNAYDADVEEAMAYFGEAWSVNVAYNQANPARETWTFKQVVTETEAIKALNEKYATLTENYAITSTEVASASGTARVERAAAVDPNTQIDDITFTLAPNATYHVKKAKKLKATKSFTVAAEAKSGNAISYKLTTPNKKISIDSATGKITVKKGLKKGTYKVTVKALTDAGNGYMACKESAQLTIKVKK